MKKISIVLIFLLLLVGMIGSFNICQVVASPAEVYYSVEPTAIAPLSDVNASAYGLETPSIPFPIGQDFAVEMHLRNATTGNVPTGIMGVEVHFYFGNILNYCRPIEFFNVLGQPGGVLSGPPSSIIYGINAGFYDDADNPITAPPYTNATQYIVLGVSLPENGPWWSADGLVARVNFQIIYQPDQLLFEPDFYAPLQITNAALADPNAALVPFEIIQGTLRIDMRPILFPAYPDVFVRTIVPSRTALSQLSISSIIVAVTVSNGVDPQTFNLTVYANAIPIGSQNITMDEATITKVNFTWAVSGLAYGNYTISAYAEPLPNETNILNNNCTDGVVAITIQGDINGDFTVTLADLVTLALAYGSVPTDTRWNPNADLSGDGAVTLVDLVTLAQHYGQHYP